MNSSNGTFFMSLPCVAEEASQYNGTRMLYLVFIHTTVLLVGFAILIGNTLVIVAVHRNTQMQTTSNCMLVGLSVADLMVGLITFLATFFHPDMVIHFYLDPFYMCLIRSTLMAIPTFVSVLHLTMIAFDRFIAISRPLRYHQIMTPRQGQVMIAFCWIYGSFLMLLPIFGWRKDRPETVDSFICFYAEVYTPSYVWFLLFAGFFPACGLLVVFYLLLFMQAYRTTRKISSQQRNPNTSTNVPAKRELKAVKTVLVIVGVFAVCWTPTACLIFFESRKKKFDYDCTSYYIEQFVYMVAVSNSAVNPIIYGFRNAEFRMAFKKIIGSLCRKC
ncbi:adenosine receptor A3-like [Ptychodera flava]|uniref:adenosine receptor A3-like n=1 Tax=Ptychodera flava TaxID=63121 RepID=UPI00396A2360